MHEIRNSEGHLVAKVNQATGAIQINRKGCITLIERDAGGRFKVTNTKSHMPSMYPDREEHCYAKTYCI